MPATSSDGVRVERWQLVSGATVVKVHGGQSGPTVALLGGVHGDENEGVLAVRRVVHEVVKSGVAGTLMAVAPANPDAWGARTRSSPSDGENLARCFPGAAAGSLTLKLAAELTEYVISTADLLIDLHSAGLCYEMPLFAGFVRNGPTSEQSNRAVRAFGAPLIWAHDCVSPGRSLSAAADFGVPAIYAECAGGGSIRASDLGTYIRGVFDVLREWGMLPPAAGGAAGAESQWVYGDGDLDQGATASVDGFFVSSVTAGARVTKGDDIGVLYDDHGVLHQGIRAPRDGVVMFLRRQARIESGDVFFLLADVKDPRE